MEALVTSSATHPLSAIPLMGVSGAVLGYLCSVNGKEGPRTAVLTEDEGSLEPEPESLKALREVLQRREGFCSEMEQDLHEMRHQIAVATTALQSHPETSAGAAQSTTLQLPSMLGELLQGEDIAGMISALQHKLGSSDSQSLSLTRLQPSVMHPDQPAVRPIELQPKAEPHQPSNLMRAVEERQALLAQARADDTAREAERQRQQKHAAQHLQQMTLRAEVRSPHSSPQPARHFHTGLAEMPCDMATWHSCRSGHEQRRL